MIVTVRNTSLVPPSVSDSIVSTISRSLNQITTIDGQFVVNDTLWYAKTRKGSITPCVVNSASFLSKNFQHNLAKIDNWCGETKIARQSFDGYGVINATSVSYRVMDVDMLPLLKEYMTLHEIPDYLITKYFSIFYGMYQKRSCFSIELLGESLKHYFEPAGNANKIRVGVEFETGNIGSSFRALTKLNNLFMQNEIDVGVFITSNDKENGATRIWPTSNRNGSFVELDNRGFIDNANLPLIEIGFTPDNFSSDAPYLGERGNLYTPKPTGKEIIYSGVQYEVFYGDNNDEILKPKKIL